MTIYAHWLHVLIKDTSLDNSNFCSYQLRMQIVLVSYIVWCFILPYPVIKYGHLPRHYFKSLIINFLTIIFTKLHFWTRLLCIHSGFKQVTDFVTKVSRQKSFESSSGFFGKRFAPRHKQNNQQDGSSSMFLADLLCPSVPSPTINEQAITGRLERTKNHMKLFREMNSQFDVRSQQDGDESFCHGPPLNDWLYLLHQSSNDIKRRNKAVLDFYNDFSNQFVHDFPSCPPFLLGRLHTAFFRSMDLSCNKVSRLLYAVKHGGLYKKWNRFSYFPNPYPFLCMTPFEVNSHKGIGSHMKGRLMT